MKRVIFLLPTLLGLLIAAAPSRAQQWTGILDPSRATDWSNPGAGVIGDIPSRTNICTTLGVAGQSSTYAQSVTLSQINSAISSCGSGNVVYLNAGTYTFSSGTVTFAGTNSVTLRGAGANQTILQFTGSKGGCGLRSNVCMVGSTTDGVDSGGPPSSQIANFLGTVEGGTGVFPAGATHLLLDNVQGLAVGGNLILDQLLDSTDGYPATGDIYSCNTTNCTLQGGTDDIRGGNRALGQIMYVTAISGSSSPYTVTVNQGITMPSWRTSQTPQAWWPLSIIHDDGLEDVTVQTTSGSNNCSTCGNIIIFNAHNCWVKGVASIEPNTTGGNPLSAHIWLFQTTNITIRNNYYYGSDNSSQSYGNEMEVVGNSLVENNIFQHVTAPNVLQSYAAADVFAYNFSIDDNFTAAGSTPGWMDPSATWHETGEDNELWEGESGLGLDADNIHGTHHFGTFFRNHYYGDIWNNPVKNGNTQIMQVMSYGRFFNFVGNVLGRTTDNYYTQYNAHTPTAIFDLTGSIYETDPYVGPTSMRWGNYDTVTGAARWCASSDANFSTAPCNGTSEIPTGLAYYANPNPASHTLPVSFYRTSAPSWWTFPNGTTAPFPAIGPDVTGGNGPAGHSYMIPAENCWYNVMGGVVGSSAQLAFNESSCYAGGTSVSTPPPTAPAPPTGLTATVQ
jgi:hypothetical protein